MGQRLFSGLRLHVKQRIALGVAMLVVSFGYLPINRAMSGGATVEIWLDQLMPFWAIWIVPYLLAIAWWLVAGAWALLKMEDPLWLAFVSSWILACLIGFMIFILYPTYMVRPDSTGSGWAESLVAHVYANDRTHNAFPSMHLWSTVTITLYWSNWKPKWRMWLWTATILVALSTVLSGQHWILDVVGGTLLAALCYYLGPLLVASVCPIRRRQPSSRAGG